MLERIGQPFLHDAIGGEVEIAGQGQVGIHSQLDLDPGIGEPVDQDWNLGQTWRRTGRVGAHRAQHAIQIGQRVPSGLLHAGQDSARRRRVAIKSQPSSAGLDHQQVDRVPDHVVQFAGDRDPFLGDRLPLDGPPGALVLVPPPRRAVAQGPGGEPDAERLEQLHRVGAE